MNDRRVQTLKEALEKHGYTVKMDKNSITITPKYGDP